MGEEVTPTVQNLLALLFALVGFALVGVSFSLTYLRIEGTGFFIGTGLFSFVVAIFLLFKGANK
jgi:hypothetical protein